MLSQGAFNALLKTLEEPPGHVKFVLATTDVHKVPETILSRCQRFDFRRLTLQQIADQLAKVAEAEGMKLSPAALALVARQAEGGMRDALSLLDQVRAACGESPARRRRGRGARRGGRGGRLADGRCARRARRRGGARRGRGAPRARPRDEAGRRGARAPPAQRGRDEARARLADRPARRGARGGARAGRRRRRDPAHAPVRPRAARGRRREALRAAALRARGRAPRGRLPRPGRAGVGAPRAPRGARAGRSPAAPLRPAVRRRRPPADRGVDPGDLRRRPPSASDASTSPPLRGGSAPDEGSESAEGEPVRAARSADAGAPAGSRSAMAPGFTPIAPSPAAPPTTPTAPPASRPAAPADPTELWRAAVSEVEKVSPLAAPALREAVLLSLADGEVAIQLPPGMLGDAAERRRPEIEAVFARHFGRPTRLVVRRGAMPAAAPAGVDRRAGVARAGRGGGAPRALVRGPRHGAQPPEHPRGREDPRGRRRQDRGALSSR